MRRIPILFLLFSTIFSMVHIAFAQDNIPPAVDAVMTDLSQRLGKKIDRQTVNWTYSEELFNDAGLGCPQPGITYKPESIKGYIIDIDVDKVTYDYRYSEKDNTFFLCSPKTVATPTALPELIQTTAPTATLPPTLIPPPTATLTAVPPKALRLSAPVLAYVARDGSLQVTQAGSKTAARVLNFFYSGNNLDKLLADPVTASTYGFLRWSPDGSRLLFNDLPNKSLYVMSSGQHPVPLVKDSGMTLDYAVNGAWSADGTQVAYVSANGGNMSLNVIAANGGAPTTITPIPACSSPSVTLNASDPAAIAYALESGVGHVLTPSALFWLKQDTYLFEIGSCQTLVLVGQTGIRWAVNNITSVAVSPDHAHIAAVKADQGAQPLVTIDVDSGNVKPLAGVTQPVDQIAWSADGSSIIYSGSTPQGLMTGDPQNALGQQIFGARWPLQAVSNAISLWRIAATGGTPTQFFNWQGYRVASIIPMPDNSGVVVSFITSGATMLKWISEGHPKDAIAQVAPHSELFSVRFDSPLRHRLAYAAQPAISTGSAFDALSAQGEDFVPVISDQCPGAPPSRLVIGQAAHVTPGDANSMRSSATGPVVGSIPGGSLITILDGPVCADKGVAWWHVDFKGIKGWTAEGQGTTYFVEP